MLQAYIASGGSTMSYHYYLRPDCLECGCVLDGLCQCNPSHPAVISIPEETFNEMLTALKDCVESLKRLPNVDGAFRVTCLKQAEDAIAKATS